MNYLFPKPSDPPVDPLKKDIELLPINPQVNDPTPSVVVTGKPDIPVPQGVSTNTPYPLRDWTPSVERTPRFKSPWDNSDSKGPWSRSPWADSFPQGVSSNTPSIVITPPSPEASTSVLPDSPSSSGTVTPTNFELQSDLEKYFKEMDN